MSSKQGWREKSTRRLHVDVGTPRHGRIIFCFILRSGQEAAGRYPVIDGSMAVSIHQLHWRQLKHASIINGLFSSQNEGSVHFLVKCKAGNLSAETNGTFSTLRPIASSLSEQCGAV